MPGPIGGAGAAEDVSHLERWPGQGISLAAPALDAWVDGRRLGFGGSLPGKWSRGLVMRDTVWGETAV
jgi:hypothetical protein